MKRFVPAVLIVLGLPATGCLERWVYVEVQSTPRGARVTTKGLDAPHGVRGLTTPTGHFLRCTVDAVTPDLRVRADSWSYRFSLSGHTEGEVFVERAGVIKACADSQRLAREKPFRVSARLVQASTEKGLTNAVLITTNPPGATVVDDRTGAVLGKTPLKRVYVFYAPYAEEHPLRLELPGYVTLKRNVTVRSIVLHANLYRPGETPPAQAPPKTKGAPGERPGP